jgi:peptidyl-prolyl cis-trans isomerase C
MESLMIASVNGHPITRTELEARTLSLLQHHQEQIPTEEIEEARSLFRKQALENLINEQLLLQEAERLELEAEAEEVDARLAEIRKHFTEPEGLDERLAQLGVSEDKLRSQIQRSMKIAAVIETCLEDVQEANEEEIEAFYKHNPDELRTPETVRASHILIGVEPNEEPQQKGQKRLALASLRGQIEKGGDFARLAREHSSCPSGKEGGDLGFFARDQVVKPFGDVAFGAKVGEISDIVETRFGYHIIKVTARNETRLPEFSEVHDQIAGFLNEKERESAIDRFLGDLRESAEIEYAAGAEEDLEGPANT